MRVTIARGLGVAFLLAGMFLSLGGAQTEQPGTDPKGKPMPTTPLPPGTILGVFDNLLDALRMAPRAVVLTPEKYKALLDRIDRLEKQLARPTFSTPSQCSLKGKIDGNLVQLSALFEFKTDEPNEVVRLGCGLAQATGVSLDGRTPRLRAGTRGRGTEENDRDSQGFVVEVDKPGTHQLTLDLVLALTSSPAGQGFTLDLPRAASTRLELEVPPNIREVRLGGKPLGESLLKLDKNQLTGSLGAIDKLDLVWRSNQATSASAVLAADSLVVARLDARELLTDTRLTLRVLSGQTNVWRVLVPLKAELKASPDEETRIARIESNNQKQVSIRTIHLKEASAAPLVVTITHTQSAPRPGSGKAASIGPFTVLGAARQSGSLLVSNLVTDWHLELTPHADLLRRAPTENELARDPSLVAAFRVGPGTETRSLTRPFEGRLSWLDIEAETIRGQIKVRPAHLFTRISDGSNRWRWQVQTTFTVTPRWSDVDRFTVQLPAGCEFVEEGSQPYHERVRGIVAGRTPGTVEIRLNRGGSESQSFPIRIEGRFAPFADPKWTGKTSLLLPRALDTIEQDGTITVRVPSGIELLLSDEAGPRDGWGELELVRQSSHEISWRYPRRGPDRVEVSWQPYRPPIQVSSLADLTLLPTEVQVRQQLRYTLPIAAGAMRLPLRFPAQIARRVRLVEGGQLLSLGAVNGEFQQALVAPLEGRTPTLVLEYTLPLPSDRAAERTILPLVVPENATTGEARVRVWSDAGQLPSLPVGGAEDRRLAGWSEQNIEIVPGRNRLPVLVLRSDRIDQPVALRLHRADPTLSVLIDRALVRVEVAGNGQQNYRTSFRLSRLAGRTLDLELPAPAPAIQFRASLEVPDGNGGRQRVRIDPEYLASERAELKGRLVRLRLAPEVARQKAILEISYRLDAGRLHSTALTTTLLAPRLLTGQEADHAIPMRWQITMSPGQVLIAPEAGLGTPIRWGWRGWLLAPRMGLGEGDLERWLASESQESEGQPGETPSLILWHNERTAIRLIHVPHQVWLLACSLGLVLFGVLAWRLSFPRSERLPIVGALLLLTFFLGSLLVLVLWPTLASQLAYGCQPGAAVFLVLACVQWLLHERYRRQIIFLPSFHQSRPGSSILRTGSSPPRPAPGEPSTVDGPRKLGSSVERSA